MLGGNTKSFKSYGKRKTHTISNRLPSSWSSPSSAGSPLATAVSSSSDSSDSEEEEDVKLLNVAIGAKKITAREIALSALKDKRIAKKVTVKEDQENSASGSGFGSSIDSPKKVIFIKGRTRGAVIPPSPRPTTTSKGKERMVEPVIIRSPLVPRSLDLLKGRERNGPAALSPLRQQSMLNDHSLALPKPLKKATRINRSIKVASSSKGKNTVNVLADEKVNVEPPARVTVAEVPASDLRVTKAKKPTPSPSLSDPITPSTPKSSAPRHSFELTIEIPKPLPKANSRTPVLKSKLSLPSSFSPLLAFSLNKTSSALDFTSFSQNPPSPFTSRPAATWKKVGEASYSEVFSFESEDGTSLVVKIIPIDYAKGTKSGDKKGVDYPARSGWESVAREIEIGELVGGKKDRQPGFVRFNGAFIVQGKYPELLLDEWDSFKAKQSPPCEDQIRPDVFSSTQVYAVLCLAHAGTDLESFKVKSWKEAASILRQVIKICALAEIAIEFEHRDLHVGNVLVRRIDLNRSLTAQMSTLKLADPSGPSPSILEPSDEVEVTLIDFTLSRAKRPSDGRVFYDAFLDPELFNGEGVSEEGDYQFDIYRCMQGQTGEEWQEFHPVTNLYWIYYLLLKLMASKALQSVPTPTFYSPARRSTQTLNNSSRTRISTPIKRRVRTLYAVGTKISTKGVDSQEEREVKQKMQSLEAALKEMIGGVGVEGGDRVAGSWSKFEKGAKRKVEGTLMSAEELLMLL